MDAVNPQDFQEGYERGVENVPVEQMSVKLTAHATHIWLGEEIAEASQKIEALQSTIEETTQNHRPLYASLQKYEQLVDKSELDLSALKSKKDTLLQEIEVLQNTKEKKKTPYALMAGILYLLAGFAFVAGDLIISHEIVAYALNIRNSTEAWAFAIGLASLSILLKPAYERLVEQPYLDGAKPSAKKIYGYFQSGLLVLSMLTMVVLGWFRYEAYKTDKLKEGINRQIKSMQMEATPIDPSLPVNNEALLAQIDTKLKAYDALNISLVNSPLAMFSFILTGLLFAVAGAICLGIAFPILQTFWVRGFQLNPGIRKRKRRVIKLEKLMSPIYSELTKLKAAYAVHIQEIAYLPSIEDLKTEKKELQLSLKELKANQLNQMNNAIVNNVEDGHKRGIENRTEMTDEEYEKYRQSLVAHKKKNSFNTSKSMRPHEKLRQVIAEDFGEN